MRKRNITCIGSRAYYDDAMGLKREQSFQMVFLSRYQDIRRKQGFALLLTIDDLYGYYPDQEEIDVYEIDRYIRSHLRHFDYVIVFSVDEFDFGRVPYSHTFFVWANNYFEEGDCDLTALLEELYEKNKTSKKKPFSKKKMEQIHRLKNYLVRSKREFFSTEMIENRFHVNKKWVYRYMHDMNTLYDNIGFNRKKRLWYVVKNNYHK